MDVSKEEIKETLKKQKKQLVDLGDSL